MGAKILTVVILGVLGVVLLPHMIDPLVLILGFGEPYPVFLQLLVDIAPVMVPVIWVGLMVAILFWPRQSGGTPEG